MEKPKPKQLDLDQLPERNTLKALDSEGHQTYQPDHATHRRSTTLQIIATKCS